MMFLLFFIHRIIFEDFLIGFHPLLCDLLSFGLLSGVIRFIEIHENFEKRNFNHAFSSELFHMS